MNLDSKLNIYLKSSGSKPRKTVRRQPPRIGYLRDTSLGEIWVVDWEFEQGQLHGNYEIKKISEISSIIDVNLPDFNPSRATVIDTETTGLAGGTGTYAFIIGAGFWLDGKFIVRQYMMRDFNEEPAQLLALAEDYSGSLISYNGKCFDIPLLLNRYRLHRFELPFENSDHLDMLFPGRRIWKRSMPGFKLTQMEELILGYARDGDIPSHLIPSIFFEYLQTRDESLLYPILHHNRDDILSLYHLTSVTTEIVDQCLGNDSNDDELLLSLGEMYFNTGDYNQALKITDKIKAEFAPNNTLDEAARLQALSCKKLGRWNRAIECFIKANEHKPDIYYAVELAKLYEHKSKNLHKALEFVSQAEMLYEIDTYKSDVDSSIMAALTHRKNRLKRKINRLLHN
ncbi:MAG: hypothetical protein GY839_13110 [candidate division Zixibacteria bacterium]|nr:hypothetical protein [candidate division Zixibacteria bacterium]